MGYLQHDTGTVASLVARLGTTMLHVLQHLQGVVDQLMALPAMNVDNHSHAAGVMLVRLPVQPFFLNLNLAFCHIILR